MWLALVTAALSPIPILAFVAGLLGLTRGARQRRPGLALGGLALMTIVATGRWWVRLFRPGSADEPAPLIPDRSGTAVGPGGVLLIWEQFGPDDAPCLLLTHGWSLTHDSWYYQKKEFRKDYRVIVWDLRHNGRSGAPSAPDYGPETAADDLARVFDAVDAGRHPSGCVLAGHSWGSMILPVFAARHPERMRAVRGLVLLSGTDTSLLETMLGTGMMNRLRRPLLEPIARLMCGIPWVFEAFGRLAWQIGAVHLVMNVSQRKGTGSRGQIDLIAHRTSHASMRASGHVALAAMDFDARRLPEKIDVPVLIVGGARDRNMPPAGQHAMGGRFPRAEVAILAECGHLTQLEGYRETNALLRSFLSRHLPPDEEALGRTE